MAIGDRTVDARAVEVGHFDGVLGARLGDEALALLPAAPEVGPWGLLVTAPEQETGLAQTFESLRAAKADDAVLAAVQGGTALTRRLVSEESRMALQLPSLIIEPDASADAALTAVLSGRCDLIGADAATVQLWLESETASTVEP